MEKKLLIHVREQDLWKGWKVEPMSMVMERFYSEGYNDRVDLREAVLWQDIILFGLSSTIQPIDLPNRPLGIRAIGILDGAMGRRFIKDSPNVLEVPVKLQNCYNSTSIPKDTFYREILEELPDMPFNSDIKVVCADEGEREKIFAAIGTKIGTFMSDSSNGGTKTPDGNRWNYSANDPSNSAISEVKYIKHGNGVLVAKYSLRMSHRTLFTTDITFFPTKEELEHDLRRGPHLSSKQQPYCYIGAKKVNYGNDVDSFYCFASEEDVKKNQQVLQDPTVIENPKYDSLEAALIAGLQAIRLEGMWPANDPNLRYDNASVLRYKDALSKAYRKFLNGEEKPNEYRVKEIIRNAVVCAIDDDSNFFHSALRLGILDVFFPGLQQALDSPDEFERSENMAIASHILIGSLQSLESFCEAFDIRRLKSKG